jgi:vacuolar protein sorting-associated protein 13A/C
MAKVINNLQVTVKNIHIRYEDKLSVPGVSVEAVLFESVWSLSPISKHPFAAGITLAGFTAVSVDEQWKPAFIESTAGAIHKVSIKISCLIIH